MFFSKQMACSYQKLSKQNKRVRACDVYIANDRRYGGWNIKGSKWAIPQSMAKLPFDELKISYREHIKSEFGTEIPYLVNQTLGCWCERIETCHAGVLFELVDQYCRMFPGNAEPDHEQPSLMIKRLPLYRVTRVVFKKRKEPVNTKEKTGKMPVSLIMTEPVLQKEIISVPPLVFNPDEWIASSHIQRKLTPNLIKSIKTGECTAKGWLPFVCRVVRVLNNKRTKRFSLEITDETTQTPATTLKVELGSQLFEPISERFITKDSLIYVEHYAITLIYEEPEAVIAADDQYGRDDYAVQSAPLKLKKRIVFLTNILKVQ